MVYLMMNAVIPITQNQQWRRLITVVAIATYLAGGIPLIFIALQDLNRMNKTTIKKKISIPRNMRCYFSGFFPHCDDCWYDSPNPAWV